MADLHGSEPAPNGAQTPMQRFEQEAPAAIEKLSAPLPATPPATNSAPSPDAPGKAAAPTPAPAPATPTTPEPPAVAPHLIERAKSAGLTEAEAKAQGEGLEKYLDGIDRYIANQYRQGKLHQPAQQQQQPAPAPSPAPEHWHKPDWHKVKEGDQETEIHPALVQHLQAMDKHYADQLKAIKEQVAVAHGYVQSQVAQNTQHTVHSLADMLHDAGYTEFGKGQVMPGTEQFEQRSKLASVMEHQFRALEAAGARPQGWEQIAHAAATLLHGPRGKAPDAPAQPTQPTAPAPTPTNNDRPRDAQGRYLPVPQQPFTPTRQPTSNQPDVAVGRGAAVEEFNRLMKNGQLKDIHDM